MSADLFAQFGSFSGGSNASSSQQQGQPQAQAADNKPQAPADDPFAFLSTAFAPPSQQAPPQPPLAHTAPAQQQQSSWPSFGAPLQPSQPAQPVQPALNWGVAGTWGGPTATTPVQPVASGANGDEDEDEDAWGDFEEASPGTQDLGAQTQPKPQPQPQTQPLPQPAAAPPAQPPIRTRIVRAPTLDLLSNSLISFGDAAAVPSVSSAPPPPQAPAPSARQQQPWMNKAPKPSNPNVLFDAEDYDGNESFDEDDNDDEFGDFETGHASPPRPPAPASSRTISQPRGPAVSSAPARPIAATPAAATSLIDLLSLSDPEPAPSVSSPPIPTQKPLSSLGFGELQPASARLPQAASHLSPLSFGSTATSAAANAPQPPKSPSFRQRNPFPGLAVTTPQSAQFPTERVKNRTPSPVTNWPTFDSPGSFASSPKKSKANAVDIPQLIEDDWDAWDVVASAPSQPATAKVTTHKRSEKSQKAQPVEAPESATSDWGWGTEEKQSQDLSTSAELPSGIANTSAAKTIPDSAPPPTNVPPPAILLSLFPTLMALPDDMLLKPMASQPAEVRNRVLSHPKTIAFWRNYLQIIVVAVRVIAGRRQRWHRDKFLSQSMSISAAGSSKGGGMKLAGIDKTQNQREDREAADVVAAWRRYVGKLRSAVATANTALAAAEAADHKHYPPLKIPELQSETVPVTTARQVSTAPRPCVICGLKRDERVRGVDSDDVQDMFGEWWVEHWGHRACRNFWVEHEATLRSK